jgi:hypothetical protein
MRLKMVNGMYVKVSEFDDSYVPVDGAGEIVDTRLRYYSPQEIMNEEMQQKSRRDALKRRKMAILVQRQREADEEKLANIQRNANYLRAVQQQNACFDRKQAQRAYLTSDLMRPYSMPYEESAYLLAKNTEFSVDVFEDHSDYANKKATQEAQLDVPLTDLATEAEYAQSIGVSTAAPKITNPFATWIPQKVMRAQVAAPVQNRNMSNPFANISRTQPVTITFDDVINAIKKFFSK